MNTDDEYMPDITVHGNSKVRIYMSHYDAALLREILFLVRLGDPYNRFSSFARRLFNELIGVISLKGSIDRPYVEDIPVFPWTHPHIRSTAERSDWVRERIAAVVEEYLHLRATGKVE